MADEAPPLVEEAPEAPEVPETPEVPEDILVQDVGAGIAPPGPMSRLRGALDRLRAAVAVVMATPTANEVQLEADLTVARAATESSEAARVVAVDKSSKAESLLETAADEVEDLIAGIEK